MKKIIAIILMLAVVLTFASCGNKDIWDTNYSFDYAIIAFPDGSCKTINIKKWKDYEGEQVQIIAEDGTTYLVSMNNCVLVNED